MRQLPAIRGVSLSSALFLPSQISGFVAEFNPSRSLAAGNLWQNTSKTTPATAHNDPVRVLRCPLSGVEWTAPSDAARGLLKISGPYAWIETDGSDDRYSASITIATGDNWTQFLRMNFVTLPGTVMSSDRLIFGVGDSCNLDYQAQFANNYTSFRGSVLNGLSATPANTWTTVSGIYSQTSGQSGIRRDGNSLVTGTSGTNAASSIWIAARDDGAQPSNVRFAACVFYRSILSASDLAAVESYLAGLAV